MKIKTKKHKILEYLAMFEEEKQVDFLYGFQNWQISKMWQSCVKKREQLHNYLLIDK